MLAELLDQQIFGPETESEYIYRTNYIFSIENAHSQFLFLTFDRSVTYLHDYNPLPNPIFPVNYHDFSASISLSIVSFVSVHVR